LTAPEHEYATTDIVGPRVLAGVQMVNISRLSTHPIPITSRGLITVAGQGPSDSNGAGKSSFIAGISLLHADDQWRLHSGAQAAAELLFTAELAGQEVVHANADHGYLIGVFVAPGSHTVAELEADMVTVWLRINRQAPHVELRWIPRLHVAYGETENDRAAGADQLWAGLPRSGGNGRTDIRANKLARTLYGTTVRCVSFLSTSVRASLTANLLAQPLNELTPERIFDAIGTLTGLNREIDDEQKARQKEYQHALDAQRATDEYAEWNQRVTVTEDMIGARERARTMKSEAVETWRSRCARNLVDGVAADHDLAHHRSLLEDRREELAAETETADDNLARLTDDKSFEAGYAQRVKDHDDLVAAVGDLQRGAERNVAQIELRAGRIQAALSAMEAASTEDSRADRAVLAAEQAHQRASQRVAAARAGIEADDLDGQVGRLRQTNGEIEKQLDELAGPLGRAKKAYEQALGEKNVRDERIAAVRAQQDGLRREYEQNRAAWEAVSEQRAALDLPGRHAAWAGTVATAEQHLIDDDTSLAEWDDLCVQRTEQLQRACFPPGTPEDAIPEELTVVDQQRRDRRLGASIRLIPQVLRIIGSYLDDLEDLDRQHLDQIRADRAGLTQTLTSASVHLDEARLASSALRATLAKAIKAKLKQVSDEFDRLDQAYGGYGAGLEYPEPEAPADPQKPWQWTITPRWRRGEGKPLSSYRLRGNTAQMDDKAVKLVCAAALAGSQDRPLLLVLDELGRNLGSAHRRDAVALFENIGRDRAISVIGALQDDMERYAIGSSSLYIKLRRTSDAYAYNQAPVVVGSETETARVQLLADWLTSYRP
jgi:hypothetical protein